MVQQPITGTVPNTFVTPASVDPNQQLDQQIVKLPTPYLDAPAPEVVDLMPLDSSLDSNAHGSTSSFVET